MGAIVFGALLWSGRWAEVGNARLRLRGVGLVLLGVGAELEIASPLFQIPQPARGILTIAGWVLLLASAESAWHAGRSTRGRSR